MLKLQVYTTTLGRNVLILNNALLHLFFSGEILLNMFSHLVFNTLNHQDMDLVVFTPLPSLIASSPFAAETLLPKKTSWYFAFYCICNLLALIRVALPKVSQGG